MRTNRLEQVQAVIGPGPLPDGCREASERRAAALGARLGWVEVADVEAACGALRTAARHGVAVMLASGALSDDPRLAAAVTDSPVPVVHVDVAPQSRDGPVRHACDRVIHGRGRASFTWALRWLVTAGHESGHVVHYGDDHANQIGELRLPDDPTTSPARWSGTSTWPVAMLVHGGFWLDWWERDLMDGLAVALTQRGWATWNLEYRRLGPSGGGWPASLEDACAGLDALAGLAADHPLDLDRTVVIGHSAGAQLAAYAIARNRLAATAPGRVPRVRAAGFVSLAGVLDLEAAATADLGDGAVRDYLGDPELRSQRARLASPRRLSPLGVDTLLLNGTDDQLVPPDHSIDYAEVARAGGDDVTLEIIDGDHFALIHPAGPALDILAEWLDAGYTRGKGGR